MMNLEQTIRRLRQDFTADKALADAEASAAYEADRRPDATLHDHLVVAYEKYNIPYHLPRPVLVADVQATVTAATFAASDVGAALRVGTPSSLLTHDLFPGALEFLLAGHQVVTVGVVTQVVGPYVTKVTGTGHLLVGNLTSFKLRAPYTFQVRDNADMADRLQRGLDASRRINGVRWATK